MKWGWLFVAAAAACALVAGGDLAAQDAPAAKVEVKVLDADGKPVAGATVGTLEARDDDGKGNWLPGFVSTGTSMSDGTVKLKLLPRITTVIARKGELAGLAAKLVVLPGKDIAIEVRLGPAMPFIGSVLDARGKPVAGARARACFRTTFGWYHADAEFEPDGSWKIAPLPAGTWDTKWSYIEAGPPAGQSKRVGIEKARADNPFRFWFGAMRKLCGVVVPEDGMPLREGRVFIPTDPQDTSEGMTATFDKDGVFAISIAPCERLRLYVSDVRHAPTIVLVDEGIEDVDVGTVKIGAGKPLDLVLQEADGALVTQASGVIEDVDGVIVARALLEGQGRMLFANVPEGSYDLSIWVERFIGGVSARSVSRRGVQGGGEKVTIPVPPGLVIKLADPEGKPVTLANCAVEVRWAGWSRPWRSEFKGGGIREIRLGVPSEGTVDVMIIGADAMRGEAKGVAIDAAGNGAVTVTVKGPR